MQHMHNCKSLQISSHIEPHPLTSMRMHTTPPRTLEMRKWMAGESYAVSKRREREEIACKFFAKGSHWFNFRELSDKHSGAHLKHVAKELSLLRMFSLLVSQWLRQTIGMQILRAFAVHACWHVTCSNHNMCT